MVNKIFDIYILKFQNKKVKKLLCFSIPFFISALVINVISGAYFFIPVIVFNFIFSTVLNFHTYKKTKRNIKYYNFIVEYEKLIKK